MTCSYNSVLVYFKPRHNNLTTSSLEGEAILYPSGENDHVHQGEVVRGKHGQLQSIMSRIAHKSIPRRKGTRIDVVYYHKYVDFTQIFVRITAQYRPKPFPVQSIKVRTERFDPVRVQTFGY